VDNLGKNTCMPEHKRGINSTVTKQNKQNSKPKNKRERTKMKLPRSLDRRLGFALGAFSLLLGTVTPALIPAFSSAAQLANRSVTMSSSLTGSNGGTNVTYDIEFTPAGTGAGYITFLFCSDTPLVGSSCTAPTGFSLASASVDASSAPAATKDDQANANTFVVKETMINSATHVILDGVTNPSTLNAPYYLRIETFASGVDATDQANAEGAETATTTTGILDWGGVAMSTTANIGVTAYVQESLTFCVSKTHQNGDCSATGYSDPSMTLGTQTGPETVLGSALSSQTDYAQLSTNAANGAIVNLKTDNTNCGGLVLAFQTTTCGIPPQTTAAAIGSGAGKFGIQVGTAAQVTAGGTASGTLEAYSGSCYDGTGTNSQYCVDYSGSGTGVASAYGSPILDTGSTPAPEAEQDIPVTFAANAAPTTPAGKYVANLNMIAVGTF